MTSARKKARRVHKAFKIPPQKNFIIIYEKNEGEERSLPFEEKEAFVMKGKRRMNGLAVGAVALALLTAAQSLAGAAFAAEGSNKLESVVPTEGIVAVDASDMVEEVMPSIVAITTKTEYENPYGRFFGEDETVEAEGAGSGVIIDQDDERILIATNSHVVAGADEVLVKFSVGDDEDLIPAKVNGKDAALDVAIVAVEKKDVDEETLGELKTAVLGSSENVKVGEPAIAIGNALGVGQTVTAGIISALEREVTTGSGTISGIQTDAAVNLGCSGGAILNGKGEVIALTEAKAVADYAESMGYGIPIDSVKTVLARLSKPRSEDAEKNRGWLGVSVANTSYEARKVYGIPEGAYVMEVAEGGAAEKAGIKKGDVIAELNGEKVSGSDSLVEKLEWCAAGEKVTMKIMRSDDGEYSEKEVEATLGENPDKKTDETEKDDADEQDAEDAEEPEDDERKAEDEEEPDDSKDGFWDESFSFGD